MKAGWLGRLRARPEYRDVAIALFWLLTGTVLWAFGVLDMWQNLAVFRPPAWAFLLTLAAMVALLPLRSRLPFLALSIGVVVAFADALMGSSLAVVFILTDLIYAAIKYGSARGVRILLRISAAAAPGLALTIALVTPSNPGLGVMLVQWGLILLVSGLWGWSVRSERVLAHVELAAQHAAENRSLRTRIAHDLHDLVANQIAVAGLHIEAAKLQTAKLAELPSADRTRDKPTPRAGDFAPLTLSLDRAKNGTDRAHRELRGLISVLTVVDQVVDETGSRAPVSLADELPALGQLLPAGRTIRWAEGSGELIREALPPAQATRATLVLRALQELVANTAKHGAGDVVLRAERVLAGGQGGGRSLRVTLENPVPAQPAANPPGTGLGIEGTRVLLAGLGGELASAAVPGGWRATLTVPLQLTDSGRA